MMLFVFNVLLLVLWLRLVPQQDERVFFNPYIAGGLSLMDRVVQFLRPVLGVLPPYLLSVVVLTFLLVFRGVAVAASGVPWSETVGLWMATANTRSPSDSVTFSLISFGLLLHRLWVLEWVITVLRPNRRTTRAGMALTALAMPISAIPPLVRGVFLLLLGAGLGAALLRVGIPVVPPEGAEAARTISAAVLMGVLAVASVVDVLSVASNLMMVLIILSFIGALLRSAPAVTIGNEGVDLLVGTVMSRPMNVGGFSFAPVIFFVVADLAHGFALQALRQLLERVAE